MRNKWTSRKFWVTAAAFLGSIGTSIAGLQSSNQEVAIVGIVCAIASTAIFNACEAYVDASKTVADTSVEEG